MQEAVGSNLPWGEIFFALAQKSLEANFRPWQGEARLSLTSICPHNSNSSLESEIDHPISPKQSQNQVRPKIYFV